jgi:hypothetical protein
MRKFKRLIQEDKLNSKHAYKTYLPHCTCWAYTVQDKPTALRILQELFNNIEKSDMEIARELLQFAMTQKKYTKPSETYTNAQLVNQLRKGHRLFTNSNFWFPDNMKISPRWEFGYIGNPHISPQNANDHTRTLIFLEANRRFAGLCARYRERYHQIIFSHAINGLGFGFGPIATANFVLSTTFKKCSTIGTP